MKLPERVLNGVAWDRQTQTENEMKGPIFIGSCTNFFLMLMDGRCKFLLFCLFLRKIYDKVAIAGKT